MQYKTIKHIIIGLYPIQAILVSLCYKIPSNYAFTAFHVGICTWYRLLLSIVAKHTSTLTYPVASMRQRASWLDNSIGRIGKVI